MEPIVVDFHWLRARQSTLIAEARWMAAELEGMRCRAAEPRAQVLEAQVLVDRLNRIVRGFLDDQIAALKEFALRQRAKDANGEPSPELPVRRITNGLNAAVAPINGLIQSLRDDEGASAFCVLLMSGMAPCLHAIGGIHDELEHVRRQYIGEEDDRDDYGVCDPATD